ncbi:hypothetical protein [Luteococcus sp. OSA5]|uniref:hypothetical protein n=1 Tax=Luteococcus sp. OSA5 TaxID=3401630 RepID=UPI003B429948
MPQQAPFSRGSVALYRLATQRPLARRSLALLAGAFGASSMSGCGAGTQTRRELVERVIPGSDPVSFTMLYAVGQDFQQAHHLIEEGVDQVKLTVDVTTRTPRKGGTKAIGLEKRYDFTLARPLGKRRFVNHDGSAIKLG